MTRKDFNALAWSLHQEHPEPGSTPWTDLGSDWYAGQQRQWHADVLAIADVCAASNPRFNRGRFLVAAGYIRRPDGSLYTMDDPS